MIALLLLVTYQGFLAYVYYVHFVRQLSIWQGGTSERAIAWAVVGRATSGSQLPLGFALVGLRKRFRARWTLLAWLSLVFSLAAIATTFAVQVVTHLVWRPYSSSPEIQRLSTLQSLLLPLVTIGFLTLLLVMATHSTPKPRPNLPPIA